MADAHDAGLETGPDGSVGRSPRPKNAIQVTTIGHFVGHPVSTQLSETSVRFIDDEPRPGFLTGMYGSSSRSLAGTIMSRFNTENRTKDRYVFPVDFSFLVRDLSAARLQLTKELVEQTGYMHLDRLKANYRNDLTLRWRQLVKNKKPKDYEQIADAGLTEIALLHPWIIHELFLQQEDLLAVIHPIRPVALNGISAWGATLRYSSERIVRPEVRFMPYVKVVV